MQLLSEPHSVPVLSKPSFKAILDTRLRRGCTLLSYLLPLAGITPVTETTKTASNPSLLAPAERHACQACSVAASGLSLLWRAVLMGQARIYWDMEHYSKVQAILQQSTDFCSEHESWKLNSAHTFFMQGGKHVHLFMYAVLSLPFWQSLARLTVAAMQCDVCESTPIESACSCKM